VNNLIPPPKGLGSF